MSNSSLVSYTRISPHKYSPRDHAIDTISFYDRTTTHRIYPQSICHVYRTCRRPCRYHLLAVSDNRGHLSGYTGTAIRRTGGMPELCYSLCLSESPAPSAGSCRSGVMDGISAEPYRCRYVSGDHEHRRISEAPKIIYAIQAYCVFSIIKRTIPISCRIKESSFFLHMKSSIYEASCI